MNSQIVYLKSLPKPNQFSGDVVLFYDSILTKNKNLNKWLQAFPYSVALKSGESLKTIKSFNTVLNKISKFSVPQSTQLHFVAVGGGSIGDFVGFIASVYMRGRRLSLIPSTWLAAADSSHGGKNGLNFLKIKNQIGSFYPAEKIYICKELLLTQPQERLTESLGEIIKISILNDKNLFSFLENHISNITPEKLYKILPTAISLKYKIAKRDPQESKGIRRLLNLGHTMGHVLESYYSCPHGIAVLLGIQFSAVWSYELKLINKKELLRILHLINKLNLPLDLKSLLKKISRKKIINLLEKDKKTTSAGVLEFIFIKKIGRCERKAVAISQICEEVKRQSLVP